MGSRLAGKCAIVTGGAQGIGLAIVQHFIAEGAKVVLADRNAELVDEVVRSLAPDTVSGFAVDVGDRLSVETFFVEARSAIGPVDILVNNAGTAISGGLEEMSEDEWDELFAVNVKSIYLMSRHAIPLMRANNGGSIINMASESAFIGFPMHPAYCATKAAVVHLSRSMAVRYAPDAIRVNSLCPGTIDTPLFRAFLSQQSDPDAIHAEILKGHPLGIGQPEDIAPIAVFLASDESRYATGAPFLIDGGSTAV